jgi:hypothetical protein
MTETVNVTVKHTYIDNYLDYLLPQWHNRRAAKQVVVNLNSYNKHA